MHRVQGLFARQAGVLDLRQLMSTFIDHLVIADDESILHRVIVKLRPRIRVRHRDLNGFDVEFLGKCNGVVDGLVGFAR